jgi:hypothetical protein
MVAGIDFFDELHPLRRNNGVSEFGSLSGHFVLIEYYGHTLFVVGHLQRKN